MDLYNTSLTGGKVLIKSRHYFCIEEQMLVCACINRFYEVNSLYRRRNERHPHPPFIVKHTISMRLILAAYLRQFFPAVT